MWDLGINSALPVTEINPERPELPAIPAHELAPGSHSCGVIPQNRERQRADGSLVSQASGPKNSPAKRRSSSSRAASMSSGPN